MVSVLVLQTLRWKHYKASSLLFEEALKPTFEYAHTEAFLLRMGGTRDSGRQDYGIDDDFWIRVQGVKQQWHI